MIMDLNTIRGKVREIEMRGPKVIASGQIALIRETGKMSFIDIEDGTGKIQVFIGKAEVNKELKLMESVRIDGELRFSKSGELTIFAEKIY